MLPSEFFRQRRPQTDAWSLTPESAENAAKLEEDAAELEEDAAELEEDVAELEEDAAELSNKQHLESKQEETLMMRVSGRG